MDAKQYLEELRSKLKMEVAMDLKMGLDELDKVVKASSPLQNEVYHLFADYNLASREYNLKTIDDDQRLKRIGRINNNAFNTIDRIGIADIDSKLIPEVSKYIEPEFPVKTSPAQQNIPRQPAPKSTPPQGVFGTSTPTYEDLEFFSLKHSETLKAFPKIYRSIREIQVRGDRSDNRIPPLFTFISNNIEKMERCRNLSEPIKINLNKLKFHPEFNNQEKEYAMVYLKYTQAARSMSELQVHTPPGFLINAGVFLEDVYDFMQKEELLEGGN